MMDGEERHERCRYGTLTKAFHMTMSGEETPTVLPLCTFRPKPAPPAVRRAWGGLVDFDRDCAVCECYAPLDGGSPAEG
jgi:hypothetical protein